MLKPRHLVSLTALASLLGFTGCQTTSTAPLHPVAILPTADAIAMTTVSTTRDADPRPAEVLLPLYTVTSAEAEGGARAPLSYTYLEVGASKLDVDAAVAGNRDADNYYGRAQYCSGLLHGFASYENSEIDLNNTTSDLFKLGVGVHLELTDKLHAVGEIAWLFNDVSSDLVGFSNSKHGYEMKAGARWMPIDWNAGGIELHGNFLWVDLDNRLASDDRAFGFEAGARLHVFRLISVGAMYSKLEEDDQISVSARLAF